MNTRHPNGDDSKVSKMFNDDLADITFKSSDDVLFKIHKKHLETASGGFTVPDLVLTTDQEPVPLEESSQTLEILFQFIHPCTESQQHRQPSVIDLKPPTLFAVAEAAEKYTVFGAMNTFVTYMYQLTTVHQIEILNHAVKHGYSDLADKVAIHTIPLAFDKIIQGLTHPGLLAKWFIYYSEWHSRVKSTYADIGKSVGQDGCPSFLNRQATYLTKSFGDLTLGKHIPPQTTSCFTRCDCSIRLAELQQKVAQRFASIPKFSDL